MPQRGNAQLILNESVPTTHAGRSFDPVERRHQGYSVPEVVPGHRDCPGGFSGFFSVPEVCVPEVYSVPGVVHSVPGVGS